MYEAPGTYKIVSYNSACNDIKILGKLECDLLIMDEVQRLKNWNTQISKAARRIVSDYSVILSGTPLENKLEELYSIVEFADQYALSPYYKFRNDCILTDDTGKVLGYQNLNAVGNRLKDILIRRRKKDVNLQLPARMDQTIFVPMTKEQMGIHDEFKNVVARLVLKWQRMHFLSETDRRRLMLSLSQMRMVCDSTFILDQKSRFDTKVEEAMNIITDIIDGSEDGKVVVFSGWERMTRLLAQELENRGIGYENLHGGVPSAKRKNMVSNFTELPQSRVFLSTDAGCTGLNLQAASTIINLDLPWNPAVLEQRIARIYRIGQQRNIQVINLVAAHTIEESMIGKLKFKTSLFEGVLDGGDDAVFASDDKFAKIMDLVGEYVEPSTEEPRPVIREWRCAYGKFFAGKACFVSLEWLPDFSNWRRYRYPMETMGEDAKHVYEVLVAHESLLSKELKLASGYTLSRKRTQDGTAKDGPACDKIISQLEMATYVCIADFEYLVSKSGQQYGWGVARYCTPEAMYGAGMLRCERTPEESRERIVNHIHSLFPDAQRAQIEKLI